MENRMAWMETISQGLLRFTSVSRDRQILHLLHLSLSVRSISNSTVQCYWKTVNSEVSNHSVTISICGFGVISEAVSMWYPLPPPQAKWLKQKQVSGREKWFKWLKCLSIHWFTLSWVVVSSRELVCPPKWQITHRLTEYSMSRKNK